MSMCFLACNSVAVTFSQLFSVAHACNYMNIRYYIGILPVLYAQ